MEICRRANYRTKFPDPTFFEISNYFLLFFQICPRRTIRVNFDKSLWNLIVSMKREGEGFAIRMKHFSTEEFSSPWAGNLKINSKGGIDGRKGERRW